MDFKAYPLTKSLFYKTEGNLEIAPVKKIVRFPTKDAQIIVFLHQNHHIYFSENKRDFEPFTLSPHDGDIRHFIQKYFEDSFSLSVSVRPIHKKIWINDAPFVLVNAQVQTGKHHFFEYGKKEKVLWETKTVT